MGKLLDNEIILKETKADKKELSNIPNTKLTKSPFFKNIFDKFHEIYNEDPSEFTYKKLYTYAVTVDPLITYLQVSTTFKPLVENLQAKVLFDRENILAKIMAVGNKAFDEVKEEPDLLPLKDRISLGMQGVALLQKEAEIEMKDRQHNEKVEIMMETMADYQYEYLGKPKQVIDVDANQIPEASPTDLPTI